MVQYDLHTHSLYSDGTLSPADLVRRARAAGVDVLALTDHDVTDGMGEAQAAAHEVGLTLVPGVEISVTWDRCTLHVVGLGVDPGDGALQAGLARLRAFRGHRAQEIDRRLQKLGIAGALAGAAALARGPILSRTHFAHYLVAAGHAPDLRRAFSKYLGRGCPGYVAGEWAGLEEALTWIRGAGGIAVLAHPGRYKLGSAALRRLLAQFKAGGGLAIEVVAGSHARDATGRFARLAEEFGLLASLGSDYHGPEKPWIDLGRLPPLPAHCTPVWTAFPPRFLAS